MRPGRWCGPSFAAGARTPAGVTRPEAFRVGFARRGRPGTSHGPHACAAPRSAPNRSGARRGPVSPKDRSARGTPASSPGSKPAGPALAGRSRRRGDRRCPSVRRPWSGAAPTAAGRLSGAVTGPRRVEGGVAQLRRSGAGRISVLSQSVLNGTGACQIPPPAAFPGPVAFARRGVLGRRASAAPEHPPDAWQATRQNGLIMCHPVPQFAPSTATLRRGGAEAAATRLHCAAWRSSGSSHSRGRTRSGS